MTPHEKIDDEDGHYIVIEDTPIGDRCGSPLANYVGPYIDADSLHRPSQSIARSRHVRQGG